MFFYHYILSFVYDDNFWDEIFLGENEMRVMVPLYGSS